MITCILSATFSAHCAQTHYCAHLCNASPVPPTWHRKAASSNAKCSAWMNGKMQRTLRLLHVPAGPRGRIRRRTHQTVSVAPALTMQSDLLRIYNGDWRLVPLRLQTSRSMPSTAAAQCAIGMNGLAAIGTQWTSPRHLNTYLMKFGKSSGAPNSIMNHLLLPHEWSAKLFPHRAMKNAAMNCWRAPS